MCTISAVKEQLLGYKQKRFFQQGRTGNLALILQNLTENRLWGNPIQLCSSAELDVNKQLSAFESCLIS